MDDGEYSGWFGVKQGLRQGCVISPLLLYCSCNYLLAVQHLLAAVSTVAQQPSGADADIATNLAYLGEGVSQQEGLGTVEAFAKEGDEGDVGCAVS